MEFLLVFFFLIFIYIFYIYFLVGGWVGGGGDQILELLIGVYAGYT